MRIPPVAARVRLTGRRNPRNVLGGETGNWRGVRSALFARISGFYGHGGKADKTGDRAVAIDAHSRD